MRNHGPCGKGLAVLNCSADATPAELGPAILTSPVESIETLLAPVESDIFSRLAGTGFMVGGVEGGGSLIEIEPLTF